MLPPRQRLGRRGGGPFFQPHCYLAMLYINPFMTRRVFTCRGKGLSPFTGYHHPGKSGLGLKAETREECHLLVSVLSSFCTESRLTSSGCHDTGEPWPRAHSRLSPPTLISNQENAPTELPRGQPAGSSSSDEIPSSCICLGLCQVDKNLPAHQTNKCHFTTLQNDQNSFKITHSLTVYEFLPTVTYFSVSRRNTIFKQYLFIHFQQIPKLQGCPELKIKQQCLNDSYCVVALNRLGICISWYVNERPY